MLAASLIDSFLMPSGFENGDGFERERAEQRFCHAIADIMAFNLLAAQRENLYFMLGVPDAVLYPPAADHPSARDQADAIVRWYIGQRGSIEGLASRISQIVPGPMKQINHRAPESRETSGFLPGYPHKDRLVEGLCGLLESQREQVF